MTADDWSSPANLLMRNFEQLAGIPTRLFCRPEMLEDIWGATLANGEHVCTVSPHRHLKGDTVILVTEAALNIDLWGIPLFSLECSDEIS